MCVKTNVVFLKSIATWHSTTLSAEWPYAVVQGQDSSDRDEQDYCQSLANEVFWFPLACPCLVPSCCWFRIRKHLDGNDLCCLWHLLLAPLSFTQCFVIFLSGCAKTEKTQMQLNGHFLVEDFFLCTLQPEDHLWKSYDMRWSFVVFFFLQAISHESYREAASWKNIFQLRQDFPLFYSSWKCTVWTNHWPT